MLQPYGPKMCDLLCQRTKGCSDPEYNELHLTCQLVLYEKELEEGMIERRTTPIKQDKRIISGHEEMFCPSEYIDDFVDACQEGSLQEVKRFVLNRYVHINCKDDFGATCIMHAANGKYVEMVDFLVQEGCDLSAVDDKRNTALHFACYSGNIDIVKKLIDKNEKTIHFRNKNRFTPLLFTSSIPILKILKDRGADFKAVGKSRNTILHLACGTGRLDMVKYVLSLNIIDVECKGVDGKTPLLMSGMQNETEIVDILHVQYGASLTSTDDNDNNVFHIACDDGEFDMVKYLVSLKELRGFEKKENWLGETPEQLAKDKGFHEIALFLKSIK